MYMLGNVFRKSAHEESWCGSIWKTPYPADPKTLNTQQENASHEELGYVIA